VEVARTPSYSEGPVIDEFGNIYVTQPRRGPIIKITPEGDTSTWANLESPNGQKILPDGSHLVCEVSLNAILKLDTTGKVLKQDASTCGDYPLRLPNDLTLDNNGGYYFTDSGDEENYKLLNGEGRICYVDSEGTSHFVIDCEGMPNGIALSNDDSILFVATSFRNEILSYVIKAPGEVEPPEVFTKLPVQEDGKWSGPDGILVNDDGKLYVAQFGAGKVFELNPKGHLVRSLPAGHRGCTNIMFGGENGNILYITGAPGEIMEGGILYKIALEY